MKYITSLFLLLSLTTQAQNDWLRYSTLSAKGGINFANFSFRGDGDYDPVQKPYFGFVYTDYVYEFLAGKFELTYSGQGSKYKYSEKGINTSYSIPYLSVGYVMSFRFFNLTSDLSIPTMYTNFLQVNLSSPTQVKVVNTNTPKKVSTLPTLSLIYQWGM